MQNQNLSQAVELPLDPVAEQEQAVIAAARDYMIHHDAHRFVRLKQALKQLDDISMKAEEV